VLGLIRLQGPLGALLGFDRAQGTRANALTQPQSQPDEDDFDDKDDDKDDDLGRLRRSFDPCWGFSL
jgi:hypothetical protein